MNSSSQNFNDIRYFDAITGISKYEFKSNCFLLKANEKVLKYFLVLQNICNTKLWSVVVIVGSEVPIPLPGINTKIHDSLY